MQALKDALEGGSPTVAWSAVHAALLQQEQQRRREISARGNSDGDCSPAAAVPRELQLRDAEDPRIVLDSAALWKQFFAVTNEMIVTKAGRRMFPVLKLHVSRLEPTAMYAVVMEFRCTHQHRWRFLNANWQKGSTCEDNAEQRHVFVHFASVAPGAQWMQETVSFAKLKLSNRENGPSKIKLNSLHKYQPYVHLVKMVSASSDQTLLQISTFTFPETQFIAVTAYQNDKVTQMKIKNNPFAKAFLGGNASERPHCSSYIQPLEMQHALITRLSPYHPPPLLPPTPPHNLLAPSPPPYPGPSHPYFQQGGNYQQTPPIHPQMTPPLMTHDQQLVYQDYEGGYEGVEMSCCQPQNGYLFLDSSTVYTTAEFSPDYLAKLPSIVSRDDDPGHAPLPTTPLSTSSANSHGSPPTCDDLQQCLYQPFHQTL